MYGGQPGLYAPVAESAYSAAASTYRLLADGGPWPPRPQAAFNDTAAAHRLVLWPAAPWADASLFRARLPGALLLSGVRAGGATLWASVEADAGDDGASAGQAATFTLAVADWAAVPVLAVASAGPGVAATPVAGAPGTFLVTGLVRGAAVGLYPATASPPPSFGVPLAAGRNASELNYFGSRWVYE